MDNLNSQIYWPEQELSTNQACLGSLTSVNLKKPIVVGDCSMNHDFKIFAAHIIPIKG